MDESKPKIFLDSTRRFGVEIEINSFDGEDRPAVKGAMPDGIHYVGNIVHKASSDKVLIHKWGHDHYNDGWVIKPDGSCGMEICTPVYKGWMGVKKTCKVVECLSNDPKIQADHRCSVHVHVDVSDLSVDQIASVISWWIKSETVFMDSVPPRRKRNRYCQHIGLNDLFEHDTAINSEMMIRRLGQCKYGSINTYHMRNGKRMSMEFRIMDNECCTNPFSVKNWVRLVVYFVEVASKRAIPEQYQEGNAWTGLAWLDPEEVFELLSFDGRAELSSGLEQVRNWFLGRLLRNTSQTGLPGVMSDLARRVAYSQVKDLVVKLGVNTNPPTDLTYALYDDKFRV